MRSLSLLACALASTALIACLDAPSTDELEEQLSGAVTAGSGAPEPGDDDDGAGSSGDAPAEPGATYTLDHPCRLRSCEYAAPEVEDWSRWGVTWTCDTVGRLQCSVPISCIKTWVDPFTPGATSCTGTCGQESASASVDFAGMSGTFDGPWPQTTCTALYSVPGPPGSGGLDAGKARCLARLGEHLAEDRTFFSVRAGLRCGTVANQATAPVRTCTYNAADDW